jgi:hypothetical protein
MASILDSRTFSAAALAALISLACEPKDGVGSGSATSTTDTSTGGSTGAQECTPGDTKFGEGDCETCECSPAGTWQCTRCDPTGAEETTDVGSTSSASTSSGSTGSASTGAGTGSTGTGDGSSTTGDGSSSGDGSSTGDTGGEALPSCLDLGEGDTFAIDAAKVVGDALVLDVGYSGGCKSHDFTLCFAGIVLDTNIVLVRVHHDAMGDTCEAFIMEQRMFDLTPLQQFKPSPVEFELDGWQGLLQYFY